MTTRAPALSRLADDQPDLPGRDTGLPAPPAGESHTVTADPLLTAVPVTGTMPAGHHSATVHPGHHEIEFFASHAGWADTHPAYVGAFCRTCHITRDIGTDRTLADLMRWYAQHAGRKALALEVATVLAAIAENGSDRS